MHQRNDKILVHVRLDQIRMVYRNSTIAVVTSLVISYILAYLLWPLLDLATLLSWLMLTNLISLYRLALGYRFNKTKPTEKNIERWANLALFGALSAGVTWGIASLFLFPTESLPHQVFLAFVIAGVIAGAVTTLSALRSAAISFILLASLPLSYRFFQSSHEFNIAMAVMIILFSIMTLAIASRFHKSLRDMLTERHCRINTQHRERSRNKVLELLSSGGSLERIIEMIIHNVERDNPEMICTTLILDEDKTHLLPIAAPSLPNDFDLYAPGGMEVGNGIASSGTAAYTGKRVIVENLTTHPFWKEYRKSAEQAGLKACWAEPVYSSNGNLLGTFTVFHRNPHTPDRQEIYSVVDAVKLVAISIEQTQSSAALQLAASIYENTSEAMMITDKYNHIIAINPAFSKVTGYSDDEVIGKDPGMLASGTHDEEFFQELWKTLNTTGEWRGEIWNRRKNGDEFVEWLTINTIYDAHGDVHRRVSLFSDITERKKADALIWQQANYDTLTQMPNRRLFRDRLEQAIKVAAREELEVALLFIDLDRFKEVNDTLGHHVGDLLLKEASKRITACVRESDTVARLGGDEFTVILNELHDTSHVSVIAQKIIDKLAKPYKLQDENVFVSASVGITIYPDDAISAEDLLKNADQAMFAAKQSGRNRVNYFTKSMQESAQQRMRLICDIHQAMKKEQFSIYYQPIISLSNNRIHKAEALLRWQHPKKGFISPADFIPVAEDIGAIHEIGDKVFKQAAQQVKRWRANHDPDFQVNINKSPVQFLGEDMEKNNWLEYLSKYDISNKGIVIEITEGLLLQATEKIDNRLRQLRDADIQVAIDDFGTGYSSLAYLKRFDIDYLKLDKSFVSNLETDANDLVLSEAIVVMAHKLGIQVVAEGVETEAQRDILRRMGCDYAQGYLIAKPMPVNEFDDFLQGAVKIAKSA